MTGVELGDANKQCIYKTVFDSQLNGNECVVIKFFLPQIINYQLIFIVLAPKLKNHLMKKNYQSHRERKNVILLFLILFTSFQVFSQVASNSIAITAGTNPTCAGESVTFTSTPVNGGTTPAYQWQVNGVNAGTNSPTFTTTTLTSSQTVKCIMTSNLAGVTGSPATSNSIQMVVRPLPVTGTLSALPLSGCVGGPTNLAYTYPSCANQNGFAGAYLPANWVLTQSNSNGSVTTTSAPASISMISSNNGSGGAGTINYSVLVSCTGKITFSWAYSTVDGSFYDYPMWAINNGTGHFFKGYNQFGASTQSGTDTIYVNAGDILTLQSYSIDNYGGACTTVISNFIATSIPSQAVSWYDVPTGGTSLGTTNSLSINNPVGNYTYYLAISDSLSGCAQTSRAPTSKVYVNGLPTVSTSVSPTTICRGDSTQFTATASSIETDSLLTTLASNNASSGNAFNIIASKAITLTGFKMNIGSGTAAEVWYKAGGYGNANLTNSAGWTQLGTAVTITPAGSGNLTNIPVTASLTIPAGQTYGIVVVCNGLANYTNGSAVGTVFSSNQDLSITIGHGGAGMAGVFNFPNSPRIWNGQVVYTVDNTIASYGWSPVAGLSVANIFNPKASPASSNQYAVTVTDGNGCTSSTNAIVNITPYTSLGTVNASPATICQGNQTTLSYNGATCVNASGFQNAFAPSNWVLTQTPAAANGSVITTSAPFNIKMISSNGAPGFGAGVTGYQIPITCNGTVTFNWTYSTTDNPNNDYPQYSLDSGAAIQFTGFDPSGANTQSGTMSIAVNAGQLLSLQSYSADNLGGACTTTISNFSGPVQLAQNVAWYDAASGGALIGSGATFNYTPPSSGNKTYYAQISDSVYSCINPNRIPVKVQVNQQPVLGTVVAAPNPGCLGTASAINYTYPVCAAVSGFNGAYASTNWVTTQSNSNGTISFATPPVSVTLVSSNNSSGGEGISNSSIVVPCGGKISFNWNYSTVDGPYYDYVAWSINGGPTHFLKGYNQYGGTVQSGNDTIAVNAGDIFTFQNYSIDNYAGVSTTVISNFVATSIPSQSIEWYMAPTGGTAIGSGLSVTNTPAAIGTYTYYAQVTDTITGCINSTRAASNKVYINPLPIVSTTVSPATICRGDSTQLTSTASSIESDSLLTTLASNNSFAGNAFNIIATKTITLTGFKMNIPSGTQAEVWYKAGGYGNAALTSSTGWTKLGATVNIVAAGAGTLTNIPITATLTITAGQTYGFVVVSNGTANYTNGSSVGAVFVSNAELSITQGHGGNGFGGAFNLLNAPRIWNGQVVYTVDNGITGFSWTPALGLSNTGISNPKAAPASSAQYVVTATDGNGCHGTAVANVAVTPYTSAGSTLASPGVICLGTNSNLTYTLPACVTTSGFQNAFSPANWTITQIPAVANGSVNTSQMPFSITMTSSDGASGFGSGTTNYSIPITCNGNVIFNWSYTTNDNPNNDYPTYSINGGTPLLFTGYDQGGANTQSGTMNIPVTAGQTFALQAYSFDNLGGPCSVTISNFSAPTTVTQTVAWYDAITAGTLLGSGNSFSVTPTTSGSKIYYAQLSDNANGGCINPNRIPIYLDVNALPVLTATATPATICAGDSSQLTAVPSLDPNYGLVSIPYAFITPSGTPTSLASAGVAITPTSIGNLDDGVWNNIALPFTFNYYGNPFTSISVSTNGFIQMGPSLTSSGCCFGPLLPAAGFANTIAMAWADWDLSGVNGGTLDYFIEGVAPNRKFVVRAANIPRYSNSGAPTTGEIILNETSNTIDMQLSSITCGINITTNGIRNAAGTFGRVIPGRNAKSGWNASNEGWRFAPNFPSYSWTPAANLSSATIINPKAAPLNTLVYNVVTTDANACSNSATTVVNVNQLPYSGTATATPATLCQGANVSLSYSVPVCGLTSGFQANYTPYYWTTAQSNSNGSINTSNTPASITMISSNGIGNNSPGTTNYTVTIPCTGLVSFNWNYTTVDGASWDYPRYSINGGAFTNFPGYNTGGSSSQSGTFSLSVSAGQTLTLQAYSQDNAAGPCTIVISNFSAPVSVPAQSVAWYSAPSGGTLLGSTNPLVITPTAGTYNYYAQLTTPSTGCTNTVRVSTNTVTVNPLPNVSITASANPICIGSSTTLTASNAASYLWNPGGLSGTSITVNPAATTTYTVTGTSAQGCTKTSVITIIVNPLPGIGATASATTICAGSLVNLGATGGVTYVWNPGGLSGTNVTVAPTSTTTYTVSGTNANGCVGTATRLITVIAAPPVSASATATSICVGSSSTLSATGANTYVWNPGNISGASITVSPSATTTYTVTGTNTITLCTATSVLTITVNPIPNVSITPAATTLCAGNSTSLTANGALTYAWNPGALSGTTVSVSPVATTTYTVTGTGAGGCTKTSTSLVTVIPAITVTTTATQTTVCAGVSTSITANGANTYVWQPGGLTGTTITVTPLTTTTYTVTGTNTTTGCTRTTTRTITVTPAPNVNVSATLSSFCGASGSTTMTATGANTYTWSPGSFTGAILTTTPASTTTYTVTGVNTTTGCSATATQTISVNPIPTVSTTATSSSICTGGSTSITANGANSYVWQPGALSGNSITVSPASTTTYTVTGTGNGGCTATSTRTITVGACGSTVNVKLFIEGYYVGGGQMTPVLLNESVAGATSTQVDTIDVQLRNTTPPYAVTSSLKVILNTNGTATCNFPITGTYYLAVHHRNALQTWSANPLVLTGVTQTYDFSNAANKAYGDNQQNVAPGVFAFYSGDILVDENIDLLDINMIENDITAFAFGYYSTDINGDGNVDLLDTPLGEANVNTFIFSNHP